MCLFIDHPGPSLQSYPRLGAGPGRAAAAWPPPGILYTSLYLVYICIYFDICWCILIYFVRCLLYFAIFCRGKKTHYKKHCIIMKSVSFLVSFFYCFCTFFHFVRTRASLHHRSQAQILKKVKYSLPKPQKLGKYDKMLIKTILNT